MKTALEEVQEVHFSLCTEHPILDGLGGGGLKGHFLELLGLFKEKEERTAPLNRGVTFGKVEALRLFRRNSFSEGYSQYMFFPP